MTPERPPVVAGHVGDDQGRSFIGDINPVADDDLRAAVQPEEGEGGAGGGAGQTDGAVELHQVSIWLRHDDVRHWNCGSGRGGEGRGEASYL